MRSSKSRSRSKTNRPRTLGNIINRVFDSSGPEGKVRGTPQQIIEKYLFLARDAQLSNDRVAAENFMQHAEHYTRILGEANRELAAEQENRQPYQPQNQPQNGGQQTGGGQNGQTNGGHGQNGQRDRDGQRAEGRQDNRSDPRHEGRSDSRQDRDRPEGRAEGRRDERPVERGENRDAVQPDFRADFNSNRSAGPQSATDDVIDLSGDKEVGLVETPEAAEPAPRRQPQPRKVPTPEPKEAGVSPEPATSEPAAKTRAPSTRRPRSPKPPMGSSEATGDNGTAVPPDGNPREAAE